MQGSFKCIRQPSFKNFILSIMHVNNIKGYVLYSWILWGVEGDRQGYDADWLNSLTVKSVKWLCWLFQLLSVVAHFFKG
jgi:hypothetical protein